MNSRTTQEGSLKGHVHTNQRQSDASMAVKHEEYRDAIRFVGQGWLRCEPMCHTFARTRPHSHPRVMWQTGW